MTCNNFWYCLPLNGLDLDGIYWTHAIGTGHSTTTILVPLILELNEIIIWEKSKNQFQEGSNLAQGKKLRFL